MSTPVSATELAPRLAKVFSRMGWSTVKPEQLQVVAGILKGDVFVVLPTGFGKSACYQCLPWLYDEVLPEASGSSIVVVVTPLTAIMKDQVRMYSRAIVFQYINIMHVGSVSIQVRGEGLLR